MKAHCAFRMHTTEMKSFHKLFRKQQGWLALQFEVVLPDNTGEETGA